MKTIMIKGVPEDLRAEFKAICILKRTTMTAEILRFITRTVEDEKAKR